MNTAAPMMEILGHSEINMEVSDTGIEITNWMIAERCQEMIEMPMVYWLQCKREQYFSTKIDGNLLTYFPSQSVDFVMQASCIQEPKSRKNQVE